MWGKTTWELPRQRAHLWRKYTNSEYLYKETPTDVKKLPANKNHEASRKAENSLRRQPGSPTHLCRRARWRKEVELGETAEWESYGDCLVRRGVWRRRTGWEQSMDCRLRRCSPTWCADAAWLRVASTDTQRTRRGGRAHQPLIRGQRRCESLTASVVEPRKTQVSRPVESFMKYRSL